MSARSAILERLERSANNAVERTIESALPYASPEEQRELTNVLLARNNRSGWVALVRNFDRLAESIQQELLARPRDLFGPLSECMQDSTGASRDNVIRIVRECAQPRFVYLLAEALMDARPEVREVAGKSLLEVVRAYKLSFTDGAALEKPLDREAQEQMGRAMNFVLKHFKSHRQATAATAALIFERQDDANTWSYFHDSYDELTRCATAILRAPPEPALAGATLIALGSSLKSAAMAGLAGAEETRLCNELARESFRLIDPVLRGPAETINHLKMLAGTRMDTPWTNETWPHWLRLIETVGIPGQQKLTWLQRMLNDAMNTERAGTWRIAVAKAIVETGVPEALGTLVPLGSDADERVARYAARLLLNRRHPEWRLFAAALLKSPHLSVRHLVSMEKVSGQEFGKLWHDYPKLPPAVQFTTTRTTATKAAMFPDQLKDKLTSTVTSEVAQGLRMLSQVTNMADYRGQIITLCGHSDPRIAASAVKLVGRLADPRLRDLLEAAARHVDPRVRANAVESMEDLHIADKSRQVLTMINSRHNRERANAIKAMCQFDFSTSRECLTRMLSDPNPLHRVSALWVVSELNILEILRQVHFIARRDPNMRVRKRAADLLETLNATLTAATAAAAGTQPEGSSSKRTEA